MHRWHCALTHDTGWTRETGYGCRDAPGMPSCGFFDRGTQMSPPIPAENPSAAPVPTEAVRPWLRWAFAGALVVGLALAYILLPLKDWLIAIGDELQRMGPLAVVAYLATYTVGSLLLLPAALMSITAV